MTEARVFTYGEVRLSQDDLDHIGLRNGDLLTVDKLPGGRLVLGRGPVTQAINVAAEQGSETNYSSPAHVDHSDLRPTSPPLKWYFCFNQESTAWFSNMIKVAVISAIKNTKLIPHCIYDGEQTPLTVWLREQGVVIHQSRVPFCSRLFDPEIMQRNQNSSYKPESAKGYYLPLQIAEIEREDQYVLFTDCDIMFVRDVDFGSFKPSGLAAVPEVADLSSPSPERVQKFFNSGVLLINVPYLRSKIPEIENILESNGYFNFPEIGATYDQGLLNTAFGSQWDALPAEYNWRPFYGINPAASIIHWHGPKPPHMFDMMLFLDGKRENRRLSGSVMDMLLNNNIDSYKYQLSVYCKFLDIVSLKQNREGLDI